MLARQGVVGAKRTCGRAALGFRGRKGRGMGGCARVFSSCTFSVALVSPRSAANVGSVSRVCSNFAVERLWVSPYDGPDVGSYFSRAIGEDGQTKVWFERGGGGSSLAPQIQTALYGAPGAVPSDAAAAGGDGTVTLRVPVPDAGEASGVRYVSYPRPADETVGAFLAHFVASGAVPGLLRAQAFDRHLCEVDSLASHMQTWQEGGELHLTMGGGSPSSSAPSSLPSDETTVVVHRVGEHTENGYKGAASKGGISIGDPSYW